MTAEECSRSQIVTLNGGRGSNIKYLPHAFTERGLYMLATVLKSERADVGKALQKSSQKSSQKGSQKGSQKSSQKILEVILANNAITTMELAELIGISQRAIAKHMATLQSSGRVRRVGPDKGGHWEVVDV